MPNLTSTSDGRSIMGNFTSTDTIVGSTLVFVATTISVVGILFNNVLLLHYLAMLTWSVSNILFVVFFYGQYKGWWNGSLPSAILCGLYAFMFITGIYGLTL
jgi:hypothetical protein